MQTLRKKNSPCKLKNEPTRFLGDGVSFKAKLIGILEVSEARGDRMCQAALADLKMAIRAAGEHKQRITVQISIDGLRLRDEKNGDCLYHHPVHKISFIAQDMSDSRAFGYIFGSPDTGHRFFGIKTDKAASQVVIAMRDLFQVVFELKKKEIELAKQHIEHAAVRCNVHSERSPDTKGAAGSETSLHRTASDSERTKKHEAQSGVVADLLDLQFELNSLQQGIHQMDKITPDNPRPTDDLFDADPFGDSFANMKIQEQIKPILPPPPSSSKRGHFERQQTLQHTPTSTGAPSPANIITNKTPPPKDSGQWFDKNAEKFFNESQSSNIERKDSSSSNEEKEMTLSSSTQHDHYKQLDIFSDLDPLGTGSKKPYVDKKDFFQHLKNPPKKVLKELVSTNFDDTFPTDFNKSSVSDLMDTSKSKLDKSDAKKFVDDEFSEFDKFKNKDTISTDKISSPKMSMKDANRKVQQQSLSVSLPPEEKTTSKNSYGYGMSNSMISSRYDKDESSVKIQSPKKYSYSSRRSEFSDYPGNKSLDKSVDRSFPIDFSSTSESPASPLRSCSSGANSRLSSSSAELENVPDPPPRGAGSILINPPPLPPKKYGSRGGIKPPPRPPYSDGHFHYDFLEREEGSPSPTRRSHGSNSPRNNSRFDDNFSPPLPQLPKRTDVGSFSNSSFEDSFNSIIQSPASVINNDKSAINWANLTKDITLSQLTSTFLTDLASNLGMSTSEVTSLTLAQLTECIESLAKKDNTQGNKTECTKPINVETKNTENSFSFNSNKPNKSKTEETSSFVRNEPLFKATFDGEPKAENNSSYDKYAVFRELIEIEQETSDVKSQKFSEDEDPMNLENREESGDLDDQEDAHSDEIEENINTHSSLMVKLPPVSDDQSKEVASYYDDVKSNPEDSDSPKYKEMTPIDETEPEDQSFDKDISKTNDSPSDMLESNNEDLEIFNQSESMKGSKKDDESRESSDNFIITSDEANELSKFADKKDEMKTSISTSSDRYAALREIIEEVEAPIMKNDLFISSKESVIKSSAENDLQELFADSFVPQTTVATAITKKEDTISALMDIFEEIKTLDSDPCKPKNVDSAPKNLIEHKPQKDSSNDDENWAKFESTDFVTSKQISETQDKSISGASPWSPEGKEFVREGSIRRSRHRLPGESDNEWKDDESEESNGRPKREGPCCPARSYPRYDLPPFEDRPLYEDASEDEKNRMFHDKMTRKIREARIKSAYRNREPMSWYDESRWEEERRRHPLRKAPYKNEEEYKAYWKHRSKQRPWNGEREGFWGPEHQFYDEECERRMGPWTEEERDNRERFSSQESMGFEDAERWYRREYDRRRYEDDNMVHRARGLPSNMSESDYIARDIYKKPHDPHYFREGRDRYYDYPPSWEEEYETKRTEESPRYLSRKKPWPKRPNSANEGREMIYMDPRPKCAMSRSECSDNDADPYHRPYRSRSRDSYWESDQEYDWCERPYWSEGPEGKSESLHRKRMNRHRGRPQPKMQSSPFEDDFTQSVERTEAPIDPVNVENRIRPEIDIKQPASPRGAKDSSKKDPKSYKSSSYFDDDLTPTPSASSDASDRQRIGSDLKVTPEDLTTEVKDPNVDGFASEDSGKDSFFNGDPRFDDDAFTFRSELEDQVPERTTIPMKSSRHLKYNNGRGKGDQFIKKSESVNIFRRENDPFDDDEFFN
ncbi:hypothetical protein TKK_0009709 [Trichogramma kaykai]|uniref:PID domain-containing protein n=1 Tax=Trichogramma kaykai TaxID=54128 RepID=A0ABD2X167_9HYME